MTCRERVREILLYGTGDEELTLHYDTNRGSGVLRRPFEGIVCNLERRYQETQSDAMRASLEDCMAETACPDCHGARLRPEVLAVTVGGLNISEFTELPITEELAFLDRARAQRERRTDRRQYFTRGALAAAFFAECRLAVSDARALGGNALRRREPAYPARNADRLVAHGRAVYSG